MRTMLSVGVVASTILSFVPILQSQGPTSATVKLEGGQVSGVSVDGVRSYKGIPFAAPPVGDVVKESRAGIVAAHPQNESAVRTDDCLGRHRVLIRARR